MFLGHDWVLGNLWKFLSYYFTILTIVCVLKFFIWGLLTSFFLFFLLFLLFSNHFWIFNFSKMSLFIFFNSGHGLLFELFGFEASLNDFLVFGCFGGNFRVVFEIFHNVIHNISSILTIVCCLYFFIWGLMTWLHLFFWNLNF